MFSPSLAMAAWTHLADRRLAGRGSTADRAGRPARRSSRACPRRSCRSRWPACPSSPSARGRSPSPSRARRPARPRGGRTRVGRGDLQREFLDEGLEVVGARDEVGLAVHLDEHADLAAQVDVGADQALAGGAAGLLRRLREAALAQDGRSPPRSRRWPPAARPCTPSCPRRSGRGAVFTSAAEMSIAMSAPRVKRAKSAPDAECRRRRLPA